MNIQRKWITPVTAGAFLLSAVTGILIFFHLDSGANKPVNEWFVLLLIAAVILHATANFAGLKLHLATRRGQLLVGTFVAVLLASFAPIGNESGEPPFVRPIRALAQAPLTTLAQVAQVTPEELRTRLSRAGIQPSSDAQSLSDLVGADTRKQIQVLGTVLTAVD